tara:strand:+ start:21 stop:242 length:222 start_codon:yes stop_codon:yes gene_type:complete
VKIYDLEEYRNKKRMRETLEKLEEMSDEVYETYSDEEMIGYERFKKLLELLQLGEYDREVELENEEQSEKEEE